MPIIILSIVSIVILIIAGFFFWVEWDDKAKFGFSRTDGVGGCLALGLIGIVLAIWVLYAFIVTIVSIFT